MKLRTPLAYLSLLAVVVLSTNLPAADDQSEPTPEKAYEITNLRPKGSVTFDAKEDAVVFSITSTTGIGKATIRRTGEHWPKVVKFQIHLRGLESFTIAHGDVKLAVAVTSTGDHARLIHLWKDGKEGPQLGKDSAYWTDVKMVAKRPDKKPRIPLDDGYFELEVPRALLKSNPESLAIGWIDFYR